MKTYVHAVFDGNHALIAVSLESIEGIPTWGIDGVWHNRNDVLKAHVGPADHYAKQAHFRNLLGNGLYNDTLLMAWRKLAPHVPAKNVVVRNGVSGDVQTR